jgi:peptidyl-prolyl cis-trans isomerase B (cyclophilin B)
MSTNVVIETDLGDIEVELFDEKAPKSVANFLQYVEAGHYAGTVFHRVIPGFMAQGGGYDGEMQKKPVKDPVENEGDNGLKNERGTLAMARTSEPHSATAQFFVNVKDNAFLDHTAKDGSGWGYAVFGKVTSGMDVVDKIVGVKTGPKGPFTKDAPQENIVIKGVKKKD